MMRIQTVPLGDFGANCYLLTDPKKNAVVVDPAESAPLLAYFERTGLQLKYIILTHGHFDHTWGAADLKEKTGAKVICHKGDEPLLRCPDLASRYFGIEDCPACVPDITVSDGDTLSVGTMDFTFIHTPGHSKGSMVILSDGVMFSGDTLFAGSIGRTDLFEGDAATLMESLRKLMALDFDGEVYPGHGISTHIAKEKKTNLFMLRAAQNEVLYDDLF